MLTIFYGLQRNCMLSEVCCNCEKEGWFVNKCPEPKDEKKIAINRKKFQSRSRMVEKSMADTNPWVVMTQVSINRINEMLSRVKMVSIFLGVSSCVGVKNSIVVGTLPIPHAITMFTKKTLLPSTYLTLIPTWRVLISQMKHHMTWLLHPSFMELILLQALPPQLELTLVLTMIYCSSSAMLHLLVWTSWKHSLWIKILQK